MSMFKLRKNPADMFDSMFNSLFRVYPLDVKHRYEYSPLWHMQYTPVDVEKTYMPVNIEKTSGGYQVTLIVPPKTVKEDINISIQGDQITIECNSQKNAEKIDRHFLMQEYGTTASRTFNISDYIGNGYIDTGNIAAHLNDSELVIQLPMIQAHEPKNIDIHVS